MKESAKAAQAWADYLAMGPGRSLESLSVIYDRRQESDGRASVPTTRLRTLYQWSVAFGWQERLRTLAEEQARETAEREAGALAQLQAEGIASRKNRVAALNDRWQLMKQIIAERAADETMANIPGGKTGLVVRQYKPTRDGQILEEYAVDTGLLKELRDHEKQAAQELGQWTEKQELSGKDGKGLLEGIVVYIPDNGRDTPPEGSTGEVP